MTIISKGIEKNLDIDACHIPIYLDITDLDTTFPDLDITFGRERRMLVRPHRTRARRHARMNLCARADTHAWMRLRDAHAHARSAGMSACERIADTHSRTHSTRIRARIRHAFAHAFDTHSRTHSTRIRARNRSVCTCGLRTCAIHSHPCVHMYARIRSHMRARTCARALAHARLRALSVAQRQSLRRTAAEAATAYIHLSIWMLRWPRHHARAPVLMCKFECAFALPHSVSACCIVLYYVI
jgi:hypothetical protein